MKNYLCHVTLIVLFSDNHADTEPPPVTHISAFTQGYEITNKTGTHDFARTKCSSLGRGYGLPAPVNENEATNLTDKMRAANVNSVHLSLRREQFSTFRWVDGINHTKQVLQGEKKCVFQRSDRSLEGGECLSAIFYVCQKAGPCGQVQTFSCRESNNTCYCLSPTRRDWYRARTECKANKGDLATSDFLMKSNIVEAFLNQSAAYWVGLRKADWVKVQGNSKEEIGAYAPWATTHPIDGNDCAIQTLTGWESINCLDNHRVACQLYTPSPWKKGLGFWLYVIIGVAALVAVIIIITAIVSIFRINKKEKRSRAPDSEKRGPEARELKPIA